MEFAVVFPFLLLLAVSIADYGYYLEHVNNITTVTRDGGRYASEHSLGSLPWSAACPAPVAGPSGAYSCPGASYSTTTTAQYNAGTAYSSLSLAALPVGLGAGDNLFIGGASGPEVTLGADAVYGATSASLSPSWTPSTTVSSGATVLWQPASANVEALIQDEAESLTVPEGGLALDNIDCCWSSSSSGSGCPTGSTLTPGYGLTPSIPTSFPAGSNASGSPSSCVSIVYFASSGGTYAPASYSTVGWWSSDAVSDTGCFDTSSGCTTANLVVGDLVQVTVMYNWSGTNPGPVFDVLNSTFHLQADITAQYALVVES